MSPGLVAAVAASVSVIVVSLLPGSASAQDSRRPPPPAFSWTGGYVGLTAGAEWGSYDTSTSTSAFFVPGTIAQINAAGVQSIKPAGFATGVEAGYNWQSGHFLWGLEGDIQAVHLNGFTHTDAIPRSNFPPTGPNARMFVISAYGNSDGFATGRARIGYVADNNWLFFATGGFALAQIDNDLLFVDGLPQRVPPATDLSQSAKSDSGRLGWVAGAGVEAPLTSRLSVKAEYLHVEFDRITARETANSAAALGVAFNQSADLKADIVRVGLNYRFIGDDPWIAPVMPVKAPIWKAPPVVGPTEWEVEVGARLWFSSGSIGAPNPLFGNPPPPAPFIISRIIYSDLDAISGETFARVDHASGLFVKGFLGAGGITRGQQHDEDFPGPGFLDAYSNTVSSASGHIGYGTIDAGYSFLRAPGAKVGAFVGFSNFHDHVNSYGLTQLAGSNAAGSPFASFPFITEDNALNALRVGAAAQFMLTDRLKLTAEAAYLPWVNWSGQDDHNFRQLLLPESSNRGNGMMLEAILGYNITDAWSVGAGGRFWAWNMNDGTLTFNFLGNPQSNGSQPARYNNERYGVFVQSSYRWGDTTPAVAAASIMPVKAPVVGPMHWTGFHVGGQLGGGRSTDSWSDPFGPTVNLFSGSTNVAGFGDNIRATGPLGGGQVGFDWQLAHWVLGVAADGDWADIRGDNTCFSGLGGTNCQRIINSLGTVTGRIGYAWDRSLLYLKGGGAWTNTTYNLIGNTLANQLGVGSTGLTQWGWTVGAGVEYALNKHWSALFEYDHVGEASTVVPFPTVPTVNAQTISVRQSIDILKVGVNYRFDIPG